MSEKHGGLCIECNKHVAFNEDGSCVQCGLKMNAITGKEELEQLKERCSNYLELIKHLIFWTHPADDIAMNWPHCNKIRDYVEDNSYDQEKALEALTEIAWQLTVETIDDE